MDPTSFEHDDPRFDVTVETISLTQHATTAPRIIMLVPQNKSLGESHPKSSRRKNYNLPSNVNLFCIEGIRPFHG
jgi:hypothetical protein